MFTGSNGVARDLPARIVVISASVGAGHDGVADQLASRLSAEGHRIERHDFLAMVPARLGWLFRTLYHRQLTCAPRSWGWLLHALGIRFVLNGFVAALAFATGRRMRAMLGDDTDVVISTYPLAGQVLARLRRRGRCAAELITYLTDPSVHPLWIAKGTDGYLTPYSITADQARALGADRVTVVAPVVRPAFRPARDRAERVAARAAFGLPSTGRLAMVSSGSWAVGEVEQVAREIAASGAATPVVMCGENETLRRRLADLTPGHVLGWVDDMATLMRACDVMVYASAGLSVVEAHATGLPVIAYRSLPGHGKANADALHSAGLSTSVREPDELTVTLRAIAPLTGGIPPTAAHIDPIELITCLAGGAPRTHHHSDRDRLPARPPSLPPSQPLSIPLAVDLDAVGRLRPGQRANRRQ
ncbi:MAG: glycosyltransferase [Sciscionella sp.]|nr:glycosyltransferase [Sciscionella sp.]